jgi:hypothetical protein
MNLELAHTSDERFVLAGSWHGHVGEGFTCRSAGLIGIAGGGRDCTYSGAVFPSKKLSLFTQNLENKGSEIFLPSRSMVLKVVTGKIF